MATMSFSIPDDIRDRFNAVFEGQNKNAVMATLMLNVIEEEERRRRSRGLVERLRLVQPDEEHRRPLRDAAE